jgi:MoxR-like ATPase
VIPLSLANGTDVGYVFFEDVMTSKLAPLSVNAAPPAGIVVEQLDRIVAALKSVELRVNQSILGQGRAVELLLLTLMAGGHALLVGPPGVAKTRMAQQLALSLSLQFKRVQFTPDLMPSDILGGEVLDQASDGRRSFRFIPGPVFCQLLLADEVNRASPRTQSALLQAMQEGVVTVAGVDYPLPQPFHVLATQNPLEMEGTYPLPEAQLDRFMVEIPITYPDAAAEFGVLQQTAFDPVTVQGGVVTSDSLQQLPKLLRHLPIADGLLQEIVALVRNARPESSALPLVQKAVRWGPGPRAGQALLLLARARAVLDGRLTPAREDVVAVAPYVLRHRIALHYAAQAEGITVAAVIDELCGA